MYFKASSEPVDAHVGTDHGWERLGIEETQPIISRYRIIP